VGAGVPACHGRALKRVVDACGIDNPRSMTAAFAHEVRVYWEDTDAGGIVFFANYLKFFERARTEWLRAAGLGQQHLRDHFGVLFVVADTQVKFLAPARLDDTLRITVQACTPRGATLALAQTAWRERACLVDSRVTLACVDAGTLRPRRIPKPVLDTLPT
jgi:acyl-CoA thioester hydrolase